MPEGGLEPPRISPYAPETHVSTIPPLRHLFYIFIIIILKIFVNNMHSVAEVDSSVNPLAKRYSIVLLGRVPLRHLFYIFIIL